VKDETMAVSVDSKKKFRKLENNCDDATKDYGRQGRTLNTG
jgi:hypothetical protein